MKRISKREFCRENGIPVIIGLFSFAMGLFLLIDPFYIHTLPYEELTEATIVVREVEVTRGRHSHFSVVDTEGKKYNIDGEYDWGLAEALRTGQTIVIRYQPAYYRLENGIQELRLNGETLVTYRNDDTINRIGLPVLGGLMVLFASVIFAMVVLEMRREARRRKKRNIKLHRKYGDKAKTQ